MNFAEIDKRFIEYEENSTKYLLCQIIEEVTVIGSMSVHSNHNNRKSAHSKICGY